MADTCYGARAIKRTEMATDHSLFKVEIEKILGGYMAKQVCCRCFVFTFFQMFLLC